MYKKCYFVDTENVHKSFLGDLGLLDATSKVFLCMKNMKLNINFTSDDMNILLKSQADIEILGCHVGTANAMDFQLSSYLGACILKYGKKVQYFIISKDKGYKPLSQFWSNYGVKVHIRHRMSQIEDKYILTPDMYSNYVNMLDENQKEEILNQLSLRSVYFGQSYKVRSLDYYKLDGTERAITLVNIERMFNIDFSIELLHFSSVMSNTTSKETKVENIVEKDDKKEDVIISHNDKPFGLFVGNIKANTLSNKLKTSITFSVDEEKAILKNQSILNTNYNLDSPTSYVLGYTLYYAENKKVIEKYFNRFIENFVVDLFEEKPIQNYENIKKWSFV